VEQTQRAVRNCPVAVIGGAGFIGSHLVDYLIEERECNVLLLDNLISGSRSFIHPKAKFQWFDIRDSENELSDILKKHQIEYVFNYAAEPYIPLSFERPLHVFNINAFAALKVLHACHETGVKAILQVSSAEIYGQTSGKLDEATPIVPHSSYAVSKVSISGLVQVRWKEARVPAIAMRQFNCVGERETHPYVIPEIISQISRSSGKNALLRLGNNSTRDFQYVGDAVRMAVDLLEKGQFGEVYNMGSEETIQIYDLARLIGTLMGVEVEIETDPTRVRPWEIWHLQSDNTKLYQAITTRPQVSLKEALERTILYFKANGCKWEFEWNADRE